MNDDYPGRMMKDENRSAIGLGWNTIDVIGRQMIAHLPIRLRLVSLGVDMMRSFALTQIQIMQCELSVSR